jgi:hypothetical protein
MYIEPPRSYANNALRHKLALNAYKQTSKIASNNNYNGDAFPINAPIEMRTVAAP